MDYRDYITRDPQIRFGKAIIKGTRIAVVDILGYMAGGDSVEVLLVEFPQLTRDQILACLAYAADKEAMVEIA